MTPKAELRQQARDYRKTLRAMDPTAGERAAAYAGAMFDALFSAPSDRPLTVALYRPRGAEMDTAPLGLAVLKRGGVLCLPCVEALDAPLTFRAWAPWQPLRPDLVGSDAPLATAPAVDPHLIITPLLAFDPFGHRLGQGGGYYDRTFADRPDAARVGLAWVDQQLDRLPAEAHDVPLHGVLTETGYIPARKAD